MRKVLVAGALVASMTLGIVGLGMAGVNSAVYAEGETSDTTMIDPEIDAVLKKLQTLAEDAKTKFAGKVDFNKWSDLASVVYTITYNDGCMGKGCGAEPMMQALRDAGINTDYKMTSLEQIEAAKKLPAYATDTTLQNSVKFAEQDMQALVAGGEGSEGANMDDYNLKKYAPSDFDWNSVEGKTPSEVVAAIEAYPGCRAYMTVAPVILRGVVVSGEITLADATQAYNDFEASVNEIEKLLGSQTTKPTDPTNPSTPSTGGDTTDTPTTDREVENKVGEVAITVKGDLPSSVSLIADKVENIVNTIKNFAGFGNQKNVIFDISLVNPDGSKYTFSGSVTVSIDLPEGFDGNKSKVVYIRDDGKTEDMKAKYIDGKMVFNTTHFSHYAIVEDASAGSPNTGAISTANAGNAVVAVPVVGGIVALLGGIGFIVRRKLQNR